MKAIQQFLLLFVFLLVNTGGICQNAGSDKYIKVPQGYVMVLKQGDTLFSELKKFAVKENIPSANFTGMGFVNVEFGFFNRLSKKYKPKTFKNLELASLHGSIAWQNGDPSIHAHGVGANKHFRAFAGHILSAVVSTGSLEIMIIMHDKKLERIKDPALGANVLELQANRP